MRYYHLRYSDKLNGTTRGTSKFFMIQIGTKWYDDKGLLEHEKTHVKQWYTMTFLLSLMVVPFINVIPTELLPIILLIIACAHNGLYPISKRYRLYCELQAFASQINTNGHGIYHAAKSITENYNLDVSFDDVLIMLRKKTKVV